MSLYGDADDINLPGNPVEESGGTIEAATAALQDKMKLLRDKQAQIEVQYELMMNKQTRPSNPRDEFADEEQIHQSASGLESLIKQIDSLQDTVEMITRKQRIKTRLETPASRCHESNLCDDAVNEPRTHCTLQVTLKDAVETVPYFDGHNMPILQFARACRRARDMIPSKFEPPLTCLLRNRLRKHAYLVVEDYSFKTVDAFISRLKTVFSPAKTSDHFRGELANIVIGRNEHILEYISRVKDLKFAITDEDADYYQNSNTAAYEIDRLALRSFLDGLPPTMRSQMDPTTLTTLDEAFDRAVRVTKLIERDRKRFAEEGATIERDRNRFTEERAPRTRCQLCNREGHDARSCRVPPNTRAPERPTMRGFDQPLPGRGYNQPRHAETRTCNYCGITGHLAIDCRKKMRNQEMSGNAEPPREYKEAPRGMGKATAHPINSIQFQNSLQPESLVCTSLPQPTSHPSTSRVRN